MSKTIKIVFTLSLVVNLFFLGLTAGVVYKVRGFLPVNQPEFKENLSEDTRAVIKDIGQDFRQEVREEFREGRSLKNEMAAIYREEEYDPARFAEKAEEYLKVRQKLERTKMEYLNAMGTELSREERSFLINRLMQRENERLYRRFQGRHGQEQSVK